MTRIGSWPPRDFLSRSDSPATKPSRREGRADASRRERKETEERPAETELSLSRDSAPPGKNRLLLLPPPSSGVAHPDARALKEKATSARREDIGSNLILQKAN